MSKTINWVTSDIIRQLFNENYLENINSGELTSKIIRSSHLQDPSRIGEPYCTHSQMVYYRTKDNKPAAIVHRYLRNDGTIGASGIPDPKKIYLSGQIYAVRAEKSKK